MNKLHSPNIVTQNPETVKISDKIASKPLNIGTGFTAKTFREKDFDQQMDPLAMVDHYVMTTPTFGAHPHAGLSAVSVIFEDSSGKFHNRDSLGNDFDILPGDLYWLKAGSGAVHDEAPRPNARIHGLQVFVNLPAKHKKDAPASKHVSAKDMPIIEKNGMKVRIVAGESNHIAGPTSPALPMTILDGKIQQDASFQHDLNAKENAWIYAVENDITVKTADQVIILSAGEAVAISNLNSNAPQDIQFSSASMEEAHFALFAAQPVEEEFVQKGPFILSNEKDIQQAEADYAAGLFGSLN
ncbi:pirin family protein [Curvivirga aplysinae]|uniref:pirin family protein n=1 Tax=Curvivirga aplysinae TaxID=2529852 RepID=UPI0012BC6642|nr:pirin family protein [Curvivirga aplysinae]MTI11125.1 pirin family protein [Curvivirga aplysinae]